ncbi:hypothetical protein IV494_03180 [Kaistella sp. G5-32]|uniref:Uncharacterized protein n=1 Tax=Kaistella gelatinilytica TaxID=2787636 RepID=A0ABS0F8Y6_9FLAO|nr:hypothetical protein [Kaistella gelatinilytica]MBF8456175.1 hypothetical protein [Kaistella gelatinilytica]
MQIYSDNHGRVIWLTVSSTEIRVDLQDLSPAFEYERCAVVKDVVAVCKALNSNFENVESKLLEKLQNQMTAFDLFTALLDDHEIYFEYFSG